MGILGKEISNKTDICYVLEWDNLYWHVWNRVGNFILKGKFENKVIFIYLFILSRKIRRLMREGIKRVNKKIELQNSKTDERGDEYTPYL